MDLDLASARCDHCGEPFDTDQPIALAELVDLEGNNRWTVHAEPCGLELLATNEWILA